MQRRTKRTQPCCEGGGKPYAEAKVIHPSDQKPETWFCQECTTEQAEAHEFYPEARRVVVEGRESLQNPCLSARPALHRASEARVVCWHGPAAGPVLGLPKRC